MNRNVFFSVLAGALSLCSVTFAQKAPDPKTERAQAPVNAAAVEERLKTGDKLLYSVVEDPIKAPIQDDVLVNSRGEANFLVSRAYNELLTLNVAGKTLSQVQAELKEKLEANYYKQATVHLKLKEASMRSGQVLLFGSVRNSFVVIQPGEQKKLLEAVLQAGPNEFANLKKVKLSRIDPETGALDVKTINVEDIKKNPTKDIYVRDGDRIEIPERGIVF